MSKRLTVVLALALIVGLTFGAAYAEVQNVKVSGDITVSGVARNAFDLTRGPKDNKNDDSESAFLTQTRVRIDADLTDNVAATMRLINERNWNVETVASTDIDLDLAYVTLKEFLYSPLSLTLGRQELKYGNQLIIGKATNSNTGLNGVPGDLSLRKAFDAIKATLNYDSLVVDLMYAKIDENLAASTTTTGDNDDVNLYGAYASYQINNKLSADVYGFARSDSSIDKSDKIYTIGTLISGSPIDNLKTSAEAAFQFGKNRTEGGARKAMALQLMADYTLSNVKMTPSLGASYTYLSGDKTSNTGKNAWNQMYYNQALNNIAYAIIPFTNLSVLNLKGSIKPVEDVTLSLNYGYYDRAKKNSSSIIAPFIDGDGASYGTYAMNSKNHLGDELDLTAIYDYTEDVQFGLTAGIFKPGKAFSEANRRTATQAIGSMKVVF